MMCPDKETLSAFYDNEIENPWNEQIAEHVKICVECQEKLEGFSALSALLKGAEEPVFTTDLKPDLTKGKIIEKPQSFWKKRIQIPVPLAAAAVALFLILGNIIKLPLSTGSAPETPLVAAAITPEPQKKAEHIGQYDDLETVIKLMENDDFNNEVIIRLPEDSTFFVSGEPQFIRVKN